MSWMTSGGLPSLSLLVRKQVVQLLQEKLKNLDKIASEEDRFVTLFQSKVSKLLLYLLYSMRLQMCSQFVDCLLHLLVRSHVSMCLVQCAMAMPEMLPHIKPLLQVLTNDAAHQLMENITRVHWKRVRQHLRYYCYIFIFPLMFAHMYDTH